MRKQSLLSIVLIFAILFSNAVAFAKAKDDKSEYLRTQALMGNNQNDDTRDGEEPAPGPAPADQTPAPVPSSPSIPGPDSSAPADDQSTPAASSKLYYCVVPKDHVGNLEAFCNKYNAPILVYRAFNQLVVMKRLGVIVTVNPANKYFISQLRKNYNAKPLKDVTLRVKIKVSSVMYNVNITKDAFVTGDFGGCDALLAPMIKTPYGSGCTMFKGIAKAFPGLLDKVTVKENEYMGFGKKRKILFNPIVTVEMLALNMNGKNKNVTLFFEQYAYETIKHAANYNWNK